MNRKELVVVRCWGLGLMWRTSADADAVCLGVDCEAVDSGIRFVVNTSDLSTDVAAEKLSTSYAVPVAQVAHTALSARVCSAITELNVKRLICNRDGGEEAYCAWCNA